MQRGELTFTSLTLEPVLGPTTWLTASVHTDGRSIQCTADRAGLADGTYVVPELEVLFGAGLGRPEITALSPLAGAWRLVDPTTVSVIGVQRLFGANGETVGFFKYDGTYTFAADYSGFTHAGRGFEFGPNDDPWDPAAVPVQVFNNNFGTGTRIVVP